MSFLIIALRLTVSGRFFPRFKPFTILLNLHPSQSLEVPCTSKFPSQGHPTRRPPTPTSHKNLANHKGSLDTDCVEFNRHTCIRGSKICSNLRKSPTSPAHRRSHPRHDRRFLLGSWKNIKTDFAAINTAFLLVVEASIRGEALQHVRQGVNSHLFRAEACPLFP